MIRTLLRFVCTGLSLILALGFFSAGPLQAQDQPTVGAVDAVQGAAEAVSAGRTRDLANTDPVLFGDRLRTGADSRLAVHLDDDTKLTLGEKAGLTIDRFVYNPDKGAGALALKVARGAFLFVGGKVEAAKGARVTITTASATLGVRGTTVWGGPLDGRFGVFVAEGRVTVRSRRGTVTLTRGQGTLVDSQGRPSRVTTWAQPRIDRAFATVAIR